MMPLASSLAFASDSSWVRIVFGGPPRQVWQVGGPLPPPGELGLVFAQKLGGSSVYLFGRLPRPLAVLLSGKSFSLGVHPPPDDCDFGLCLVTLELSEPCFSILGLGPVGASGMAVVRVSKPAETDTHPACS